MTALLAVVALAGCAGGGGTDPFAQSGGPGTGSTATSDPQVERVSMRAWASKVCHAFEDWNAAFDAQPDVPDNADPAQVVSLVRAYLRRVKLASQQMVDIIDDGKAPDVSGGQEVVDKMATIFSDVRDVFARAAEDAGAAQDHSPQEITEVLEAIKSDLDEASSIFDGFDEIERDYPEAAEAYHDAAVQVESCRSQDLTRFSDRSEDSGSSTSSDASEGPGGADSGFDAEATDSSG